MAAYVPDLSPNAMVRDGMFSAIVSAAEAPGLPRTEMHLEARVGLLVLCMLHERVRAHLQLGVRVHETRQLAAHQVPAGE